MNKTELILNIQQIWRFDDKRDNRIKIIETEKLINEYEFQSLDKEHMRTIFEQSRSTKANFEEWYQFNYNYESTKS